MDAYELAERFELSLTKAKKIAKAWPVPATKRDPRISAMRLELSRGKQLSARQLLILLKEPGLRRHLGKYDDLVFQQIHALGNVQASAAPIEVYAHVRDAASGDRESVEIVMEWLKGVLPTKRVRSQWITVRLLIDQWPMLRNADFYRAHMALKNVRAHPAFDGWWDFEPIGSQWPTVYWRPRVFYDL
jgi:hypothetical protein